MYHIFNKHFITTMNRKASTICYKLRENVKNDKLSDTKISLQGSQEIEADVGGRGHSLF